jgi:hypothetical protein
MSHQLAQEWLGSRFPPGGYPYQDERTGMRFDAMAGGMDDRVLQVRQHRIANPNQYPNPADYDSGLIRQQVTNYICERRPELCGGDAVIPTIPNPATLRQSADCPKCGSPSNAVATMCASCGGNKVKYWTCSCGERF